MLAIDTSLKVGKRSKLVFVEDPNARVSASRSAGEGANARIESVERNESMKDPGAAECAGGGGSGRAVVEPLRGGSAPCEDMLGKVSYLAGATVRMVGLDGFLSWKTLASGFNPFFSLVLSLGEEENQRLCAVPCAVPTFESSDSLVLDLTRG